MSKTLHVFISSKMLELHDEREMLEGLLPTLGGDSYTLKPWIFESDAIASDSSIRSVYLRALEDSALYIGLFWNDFGEWTVDEYFRAGELGITRHVYVKNMNPEQRDARLADFLNKQSDVRFGITPRWFKNLDDLKTQVSRSVEQWLLERQVAYHSTISAVIARSADDIPELPRKLVGRDGLIRKTEDLLDDNERVLLRGFGGSGKTALAATVAANYLEDEKGQVVWLRAGSADVDDIFSALGRVFDAQKDVNQAVGEERIQVIRKLLKTHHTMPVLDDVWNGAALATFVKAVPRRMPLLVTSRHHFPLDEILEVGELEPAQAQDLLVYYARQRDLRDSAAVVRLCEVLGYHAFALEIAGKMLKVHQISPAELLTRIENAPHELNMPGGFGELGRTGIKAVLDTSVDALDKALLDVFLQMGGMFEPTVTPELLTLVMNQEVESVQHILEGLEQQGLIHEQMFLKQKFYRLHDLAYSYAHSMFRSRGLSPIPIVNACHRYTQIHKDDLAALEVEQSNILEAVESAHEIGEYDVEVDIMHLLTVAGRYFVSRGHTGNSLELLKTAIETALKQGKPEIAHHLYSKLGNTYLDFLGNLDKALEAYQAALELARQLKNPQREAILLTVIGRIHVHQKDPDADHYYEQAEKIARDSQDDFALCFVLHHRGFRMMNQETPDYQKGNELSAEAARLAAQLEHHELHVGSLVNQGGCLLEMGHYDEALKIHQAAYRIAEQQNNYPWMASALQSIGEDYHHLKQREAAQQAFTRALSLWLKSGGKAQMDALIAYMEKLNYSIETIT